MTNIYNLFKFIESKKPEYRTPLKFKLIHAPETMTPEDLHVGGFLNLKDTKIAEKYSAEEIRKMIEDTGGSVKGTIYV